MVKNPSGTSSNKCNRVGEVVVVVVGEIGVEIGGEIGGERRGNLTEDETCVTFVVTTGQKAVVVTFLLERLAKETTANAKRRT